MLRIRRRYDGLDEEALRTEQVFNASLVFGTVTAAMLILVFALSPLDWQANLVISGVIALMMAVYVHVVVRTIRKRVVSEWQKEMPVTNQWVTARGVSRIRHLLTKDDAQIHLVAHRQRIVLLQEPLVSGMALLGTLFLTVAAYLLAQGDWRIPLPNRNIPLRTTTVSPGHQYPKGLPHLTPPQSVHLPQHLHIHWWLPLLGAMICFAIAAYQTLPWMNWFFVVTDARVILTLQHQPVFTWRKGYVKPLPLHHIRKVEVDGSEFGKTFGNGFLSFGTDMQDKEDEAFQGIRGLPKIDEIEVLLRTLVARTGA